MIKVRFLDFSKLKDKSLIDDICEKLPQFIKEKTDNINNEERKTESIFSWYLLCKTLLSLGFDVKDYEFLTGANKKPYVKGNPFYFNLSHANGWCACIVASSPCGIDIEYVKDYSEEIVDKCFSKEEKELILKSEDKNGTFFKIWTLKESYVKMKSRSVFNLKDINILSLDPVKSDIKEDVYLYTFDIGKFKLSVSLSGKHKAFFPEEINWY